MKFGDVAAFVIHDVKNRLTALAGQAEARGDRHTLRVSMEAAASLVSLLAFYRAENGSLDVNIDAHAPADVLQDVAAELGQEEGISLLLDLEQAPTLWFFDESLVRMVLLQALNNGLRHARSRIVLSAMEQGDWLIFHVHDDGAGYPQEMLGTNAAIQPLSRDGTGLGLHLAARVAELHCNAGLRGYVELRNADGADFILGLPR